LGILKISPSETLTWVPPVSTTAYIVFLYLQSGIVPCPHCGRTFSEKPTENSNAEYTQNAIQVKEIEAVGMSTIRRSLAPVRSAP
jgi:hypothetical protein